MISKFESLTNDIAVNLDTKTLSKKTKKELVSLVNVDQVNKIQNFLIEKRDPLLLKSWIHETKLYTKLKFMDKAIPLKKVNFTNARQIVKLLKKLHNLPITNLNILPFNFYNEWTSIQNKIKTKWFTYEKFEKFNQQFHSKYYSKSKVNLCHNDLHKDNILIKDKYWFLIDWDYAVLSDKYMDYASLFIENFPIEVNIFQQFEKLIPGINLNKLIDFIRYQLSYWLAWANYVYELIPNNEYVKIYIYFLTKVETLEFLRLIK